MNPVADRLEAHFTQWLRTLESDARLGSPGDTGDPDGPHGLPRSSAPVRYGEWEEADGHTREVRMTRPEWMLNQLDAVLALGDVITPDDVTVVAAPYELSLEGASIERAVEWLGASLISVGTSNTICPVPRLLDLIHRYRVTTLACPPQLAAELAALDEAAGRDPGASGVHTLIATRPAAPERLRRIAAAWGASAFEIFSTPSRPATATPCGAGRLHLPEDRFDVSLRSPAPGRIDSDGTRGELLLTARDPESSTPPALPTGELVELRPSRTPCACGSGSRIVIPLGRVADAVPTPRGPVSQVDVEHCLFTSPEPQGRVTSTVEDGRLSVAFAVRSGTDRDHAALQELVLSRLGPAVELVPFVEEIAEADTRARSSR
ncbi:hypothetical protein ACFWU3_29880 [Streptomyces sp. NPDC058685]|uniref:hypothetical protein n=1 Tax=Streptomyces sp. NPDC058685 TaxID=3346598 RepID=UPI003651E50E